MKRSHATLIRNSLLLALAALALGPAARAQQVPAKQAATRQEVNYDEARIAPYTLPDPLKVNDGTPVASAEQWTAKRRPEVLKLVEDVMYGRCPVEKFKDLKFKVTGMKKDALGGKATRKLIHISLSKHPAWGGMDVMLYTPNGAQGPVPCFAGLSFGGNHAVSTEKDVPLPKNFAKNARKGAGADPEASRGKEAKSWPVELALSRGYAVATAWYIDIEPDREGGWKEGLRGALAQDKAIKNWDAEKDWSAIGAWAWGVSRILDYLQTDPAIDAKRVFCIGHSRLGKTSLWAGASDERFAMACVNDSGEGGAAITRRNIGETMGTMQVSFPYWFCARHWDYVGKENELPVDSHMIIALIAPRPVCLASASKDAWADPKGEFLGGKAAEPVYALFKEKGLGVAEPPQPDTAVGDFIHYHMRTGEHAMLEFDWTQYLDMADKHFGKK